MDKETNNLLGASEDNNKKFDSMNTADISTKITSKFFEAGSEWLKTKNISMDSPSYVSLLTQYVRQCEESYKDAMTQHMSKL
jgi:hypothetical protein